MLYLRDPHGVLMSKEVGAFEADTALPTGAFDTGLRSRGRALFLAPDGEAAYVRTTDGHVERWPRSADPDLGCA